MVYYAVIVMLFESSRAVEINEHGKIHNDCDECKSFLSTFVVYL